MIYNLLIATILIVAFFMCYNIMDNNIAELKEQIRIFRSDENKRINQIELLRSESLESYRKGLYDGLEVKKDNILVVEPKPIKTLEDHQEVLDIKKAFKAKEEEINSIVEDYWG